MKHNAKSLVSMVMEYIVLIAPTAGYSIYCYYDTLQYTMSSTSKGSFWTLISLAVLAMILFGIFRKRYDRYVQGYIQQKTDLETNPDNELLIKRVAKKKEIIENIDYVVALIPILILLTVISAFQQAIDQLMILLTTVSGSLIAKVGVHIVTINLEKSEMLKRAKDGEDK